MHFATLSSDGDGGVICLSFSSSMQCRHRGEEEGRGVERKQEAHEAHWVAPTTPGYFFKGSLLEGRCNACLHVPLFVCVCVCVNVCECV